MQYLQLHHLSWSPSLLQYQNVLTLVIAAHHLFRKVIFRSLSWCSVSNTLSGIIVLATKKLSHPYFLLIATGSLMAPFIRIRVSASDSDGRLRMCLIGPNHWNSHHNLYRTFGLTLVSCMKVIYFDRKWASLKMPWCFNIGLVRNSDASSSLERKTSQYGTHLPPPVCLRPPRRGPAETSKGNGPPCNQALQYLFLFHHRVVNDLVTLVDQWITGQSFVPDLNLCTSCR